MKDLVFSYIADIDRDLIVQQGIRAQVTRVRQPRPQSVNMVAPRPIAVPGAQPALITDTDVWESAPQLKATRPRRDNKNGGSAPPSIPLRMLLPKGQQRPRTMLSRTHALSPPSMPTPPMSPSCVSVDSRPSSINPRFSDAHVEYVGKDCVIHNGAQIVDIAMEFAALRAAPRLVSFPHQA
ncbi:hypothetical protein GGF46_000298 [Coemansia sp. RSA 552]|nr:hypothetical protein GGF46_000298 [Coemansia sp. RSA 552]